MENASRAEYKPGTIVEVISASNWDDEENEEILDIIVGQIGVITMHDPSDSTQTYFVSFNNKEEIKELLESNDFANNTVSDCFASYSDEVTSKFVLFEDITVAKMDTRVGLWFEFNDLKVSKALFPREGRFL